MLFLNDMLDYYLLIDNNYKSFFNEDLTIEIKRYEKILKDLNTKLQRIKNAYLNSNIEQDDFIDEEKSIKMQIEETKIKLNNLNNADENLNHKDALRLYNNLFQLEKMKYKSYYVRKNGLWNKLTKEQKSELITKYIDSIEIEKNKEEIIIKKININKKEIQNIGYMFRNDCFDMAVNINDRDVILSNERTKEDINKYIESLSKFYKIVPITIEKDKLDIDSLSNNSLLQIIPNKKENKFENGFILDGFPRTIVQARELESIAKEFNFTIDAIVNLSIPEEKLIKRLSGRRTCKNCGSTFHIEFNPPKLEGQCDKCGGTLYQREDESEEAVKVRLDTYNKQTKPLIDYYTMKGTIININGDQPMEDVFKDIEKSLEGK